MSEFSSDGQKPFPYTTEDDKRTAEFSKWPEKLVRAKRREYELFLTRGDIMPRARRTGRRVLNHLEFEDEFNKGEESFRIYIESKKIEAAEE